MSQRLGPLIPAPRKLHPDYTASDAAGNQATLSLEPSWWGSDVGAVITVVGDLAIVLGIVQLTKKVPVPWMMWMASWTLSSVGLWMSTLGVYTLTYTAVDNSGNQAIPAARTVFIVDTGKPTLELLGLSTDA